MTVTSRADPSSNLEGRCRPLPMPNYLTFDLEPRRKKNLLQSDWTDARSVCKNRTRVYSEHHGCSERASRALQRKMRSQINAHYAPYVTLAPASYCELGLRGVGVKEEEEEEVEEEEEEEEG